MLRSRTFTPIVAPLFDWLRRNHSPIRRLALCLALAVLAGGLVFSLQEQGDALADMDWRYLALVVALPIPLVLLFTILEYILMGRLLGRALGFAHACEVTVIGVAANMLPLPGSMLVRMAGLKAAGAGLRDGAVASLFVFLVWLALAAVYSGIAVAVLAVSWLALLLVASGTALLIATMLMARRYTGSFGTMTVLAAMRLAVVVLEAIRIYLCFRALGAEASFVQSSALTVTTALGSAVSIVPAGLGIREVVAAAFSPLLGLALSVGFLATLLNRLLAMAVVLPVAGLLILRSPGRLGGLLPRGQGEPG